MTDPAGAVVETVPARAALAGNPSDGYGGAVLAMPVPALAATVVAQVADRFEVDGGPLGSLDAVRDALRARQVGGLDALVVAAVDAFADHLGPPAPCSFTVTTTIPRSVGLAGSSAIVIGVLRALCGVAGRAVPAPDRLASVALAAEVDGLGITAGLQDRIVQCHDRTMHMEFATGEHTPVEAVRPRHLLLAHRPSTAASSDDTHRPLRARFERGDGDVRRAMRALADEARRATRAMRAGDTAGLGAAMDRSFDIRCSILDLDPAHVEMVDAARAAGAAANFAGSGGAVTVLGADAPGARRARSALEAIGCTVLDPT